jgi:recombination protein RecA
MEIIKLNDFKSSRFNLTTGSHKLDSCLNGALFSGRIYEFFGIHSSGKSTIAYKALADAERQDLNSLYIDTEFKSDKRNIEANGVTGSRLSILQDNNMEQIFSFLKSPAFYDNFDVVVFDSLTAMRSVSDSMSTVGVFAGNGSALISAFMADFAAICAKHDVLCVVIDQIRFNLNSLPVSSPKMGYESNSVPIPVGQLVSSCGNAVSHHATARVQLIETHPIFENGLVDSDPMGQKTNFIVVKNHQGRPMMSGSFYIEYDKGMVVELELADLAIKKGVFRVNESRQVVYDGKVIASSKGELIKYLKGNPSLKSYISDFVVSEVLNVV